MTEESSRALVVRILVGTGLAMFVAGLVIALFVKNLSVWVGVALIVAGILDISSSIWLPRLWSAQDRNNSEPPSQT